jgi:hypothetical protein
VASAMTWRSTSGSTSWYVAVSPETTAGGRSRSQENLSVLPSSFMDSRFLLPPAEIDSPVFAAFGAKLPSFCFTRVVSTGTQAPFCFTRCGVEE